MKLTLTATYFSILMSTVTSSAHSTRLAKHILHMTFEDVSEQTASQVALTYCFHELQYASQVDHLENRENEQQGSISKVKARVVKAPALQTEIGESSVVPGHFTHSREQAKWL